MASKPIQDQSKAKNQEDIKNKKKSGKRQGIAQKPIDEAFLLSPSCRPQRPFASTRQTAAVLARISCDRQIVR